ncbi:MAG: LacI family DNA-binding transcriptional regulator [Actinomycetia bacterium]|nr:LacI family DNA-binding transcriptional regulator [Actinomycetes bacterium]
MKSVRLIDIARRAEVSEATVSRVLNNKPGVKEATRASVLEAIDAMGYERPTQLRERETGLVGLITPELTNPIFPAFAQTIETLLARHGYTPLLCTQTTGGVHEDEYVRILLERGVSGIIYVSGQHADTNTDPGRYRRLREQDVPIVLINGFVEGVDAPFISNDDVSAMQMGVKHLADLGHTRIGLAVGPARYVPVQRKTMGFRQAMRDVLGLDDVEELIATTVFTVEGGASAAKPLIDAGASAIICGSDIMALGVAREVRDRGMSVPEDVSVIGFDDSMLISFTDPPLTTLRQNVLGMGEAAVQALLEEIDGSWTRRGEHVFRPELVVRGSTGPGPAVRAARAPR